VSVAALLGAGRVLAAQLLVDTGTISRPTNAGGTLDPDTGIWTPVVAAVIYTGPCRVRMPDAQERSVLFGDAEVTRTRFTITFPYDIPEVSIDDVVIITVSADPHITSRRFRVTAVLSKSVLMNRTLGCEVVE